VKCVIDVYYRILAILVVKVALLVGTYFIFYWLIHELTF
jgi:CHASE3 domain sensor protein